MNNTVLLHKLVSYLSVVALLAPALLFAQSNEGSAEASTLAREFVGKINDAILYPLIALMMAIALLVFVYGAFEYVRGASNETAREQGRKHLLYGIIGMLVMLSALAILYIAAGTFGLENELDDSIINTGIGVSGDTGGTGGSGAGGTGNRSFGAF